MAACTYDNPVTMARECWQDGVLISSFSYRLFFVDPFPVPPSHFFFGANIGYWSDGQVVGDKTAIVDTNHKTR